VRTIFFLKRSAFPNVIWADLSALLFACTPFFCCVRFPSQVVTSHVQTGHLSPSPRVLRDKRRINKYLLISFLEVTAIYGFGTGKHILRKADIMLAKLSN
jgi:hypothetical protein